MPSFLQDSAPLPVHFSRVMGRLDRLVLRSDERSQMAQFIGLLKAQPDCFRNSRCILGNPWKNEPYGYCCTVGQRAFLAINNSTWDFTSVALELSSAWGWPTTVSGRSIAGILRRPGWCGRTNGLSMASQRRWRCGRLKQYCWRLSPLVVNHRFQKASWMKRGLKAALRPPTDLRSLLANNPRNLIFVCRSRVLHSALATSTPS